MKKIVNILFSVLLVIILFSFENIYAATATISVSSNTSQIVVGKEFTVTVKISSGTSLGSWEWVIDYNSKNFKLISGTSYVVDYASNGSKKSASYTYKFKAIGTGSGNITVKSAGAYDWSEKKMSISKGSKTVKVITQEQLEASYSKNNDLKNLSIDGLTLSPKFDKSTLEYTVQAEANTTKIKINATKADSKASINGTGEKEVSEGENKFEIVVTAENGSSKTYTVIVNVVDPNPIVVTTTTNEQLTVVKRESNLILPENYELTTITLNEQKVPALYNEVIGYTLIGLKDKNGDIQLYIYDKENNTYKKYVEVELDKLMILPLSISKEIGHYKKGTVTIADTEYEALTTENKNHFIIYAKNLNNSEENYYIYDKELNTIITYDSTENDIINDKLEKYFSIILLLSAESIIIFFILIGILISKSRKNKKRRKILAERKLKEQKEKENIENNKEINNKKKKKNS